MVYVLAIYSYLLLCQFGFVDFSYNLTITIILRGPLLGSEAENQSYSEFKTSFVTCRILLQLLLRREHFWMAAYLVNRQPHHYRPGVDCVDHTEN